MIGTKLYETVRRSFSEFLAVPFGCVVGFLALGWLVTKLDGAAGPRDSWSGWRRALASVVGSPDQAEQLMSTIATSLVTMSSITFSILLLAVQQSSAALTNQVVDQYMRRRLNQWFFGFFVGSSLFALSCLALARKDAVPVLATTLSMTLAIVCLMALVLLIYSTLDQTRPSSIIATIHDSTVDARKRQLRDFSRVRVSDPGLTGGHSIKSEGYGYLSRIEFDKLHALVEATPDRTIVVERPVGAPVCWGQEIATVHGGGELSERDERRIRKALHVTHRRELQYDPGFGLDQLGNIGWTAVSTAKSNPAAGLIAIQALNDLLFRWGLDGSLKSDEAPESRVVCSDPIMDHMACAFESLFVVASESIQHQSLAEASKGVSRAFSHQPTEMQDKLVRAVVGTLSALGDHVPTDVLCKELERLAQTFRDNGRAEDAAKVSSAWEKLSESRGTLHSRADRVP